MQLNECGKVFISTDFRLHALECFYCKAIFTQWEDFITHTKTNHKDCVLREQNGKLGKKALKNLLLAEIEFDEYNFIMNDETDSIVEKYLDEAFENLSEITDVPDNLTTFEKKTFKDDNDAKATGMEGNTTVNTKSDSNMIELGLEQPGSPIDLKNEFEENQDNGNLLGDDVLPFEVFFEVMPHSQVLALIQIMQEHPILLNPSSKKNDRVKCLHGISNEFNMSKETVLKYIHYITTWFISEKNRKSICFSKNVEFKSSYPKYFEKCDFLNGMKPLDSRKRAYNSDANEFKCTHCDKIFANKYYLKMHLRRHDKDFAYRCEICGKRTINSTDMKTHMRVHTGEKPYVCETCGKAFKTCSFLSAHRRKHGVPKFQCSLCPNAYFQSHDLKNHINAHLNIRNFQCEFCSKAFTSAKLLYSHKRNSHSKKPKEKK